MKRVLNSVSTHFTSGEIEGVMHYLDHDELELGFELVCLFLLNHRLKLPSPVFNEILELGSIFDLINEPMGPPDFWEQVEKYAAECRTEPFTVSEMPTALAGPRPYPVS